MEIRKVVVSRDKVAYNNKVAVTDKTPTLIPRTETEITAETDGMKYC